MSDGSSYVDIDVARTCLQKRFFDVFAFDTPSELLAAVDGMEVDVDTISRCRDIRLLLADGWLYWLLFAKGYLQYRNSRAISAGNVYYDYLVSYFLDHGHNPGMRDDLENVEMAAERVARRYRDVERLAGAQANGAGKPLDPIRVTVSDPPAPSPYLFFPADADTPIVVRAIDGWHRLFSARLCGVSTLRCEVIDENLAEKHIDGVVEECSFARGGLTVSGWWLDPQCAVYNYELRLRGETIATGTPVRRADIARAHPEVLHAKQSGFAIDCQRQLSPDDASDLLLVALQNIIPVGILRLTSRGAEAVGLQGVDAG